MMLKLAHVAEWLSSLPPRHFPVGVAGSSPAMEIFFPFFVISFFIFFHPFKEVF